MKIIRTQADVDEGVAALRAIDPRLDPIIGKAGDIPLRLIEPGFVGLADIVVSQVVSRASAEAIWGRIVARTGAVTSNAILALDETALASTGLSRAKTRTLIGLATSVEQGELDLTTLNRLDGEEAMARLTALDGIGPWTAQVYLMFSGGHVDIFPAGDVALQAAVAHGLDLPARPSGKALQEIAIKWSPWRSVAARIFWAYYAATARREMLPVA